MRQGNLVRLAGIIVLIAFAAWVDWPANTGVHLGPLSLTPRVVEGLDLRGGVRVLLEADLPETTQITAEQMQVIREILEKRVNSLGVTEPIVQVAGQRRVLVDPGDRRSRPGDRHDPPDRAPGVRRGRRGWPSCPSFGADPRPHRPRDRGFAVATHGTAPFDIAIHADR